MIDDMVYGHQKAKKVIEVLIQRSKERYYNKCVLGNDDYKEPIKCLLVGSSGTGKTHLIESYSKLYGFPILKLDATHLDLSGRNEGISPEKLRNMMIERASSIINPCSGPFSIEGGLNQLVVFVDEFDKLGISFDSSGNWNTYLQSNFLTLIDDRGQFSGVSWIFAGAFSRLRTVSKSIGFFNETSTQIESLTDLDIIRAGIIPELVGRISAIVELDTFTKEDYRTILEERLLPLYPELKTQINISQSVEKAFLSGQGIRSLKRELEMLSIEVEHGNIRSNPDTAGY